MTNKYQREIKKKYGSREELKRRSELGDSNWGILSYAAWVMDDPLTTTPYCYSNAQQWKTLRDLFDELLHLGYFWPLDNRTINVIF